MLLRLSWLPALWGLTAGIGHGATVIIAADADLAERQAATELSAVWKQGTGVAANIQREESSRLGEAGPWFFIGETRRASGSVPLGLPLDPENFRIRVMPGGQVIIRAASATGLALALAWYEQHEMGVRWLGPGPLGESVPSLKSWTPSPFDRSLSPAFHSRALRLPHGGEDWARHNGLNTRANLIDSFRAIYPPAAFDQHPDWFPLLEGRRYRPLGPTDYNWQPNLALRAVVNQAIAVATVAFTADAAMEEYSLCLNDSVRFDQSDATMHARGPLRWFRGRPDYSDLVFGFMNRVADGLARSGDHRRLATEAYYWCENTPSFPVAPNIVPWLTADRSQWFDPRFAAEDQALIQRWGRSGAKNWGLYDYLNGAPYLVPRFAPHLLGASIQFAYRAGARLYFADADPHWGFDGPKLWVVSQLLWDPSQSVDELLRDYYNHEFAAAASPMQRFFALCEQAWMAQPRPGWWLKYFEAQDQARIFPAPLCASMRSCLDEAQALAPNPVVSARVSLTSVAFAVTERFVAFCDSRVALSNAAVAAKFPPGIADPLINDYRQKRVAFEEAFALATKLGAMAPLDLALELRDDPLPRAEARLQLERRLTRSTRNEVTVGLRAIPIPGDVDGGSAEIDAGLKDTAWLTLAQPARLDDRSFIWNPEPWLCRGEPAEDRTITVHRNRANRISVRLDHCAADWISQWVNALPQYTYVARVDLRAKIKSGAQVFLIMSWKNRAGEFIGRTVTDQVPVGDWANGRALLVQGLAPSLASLVGIGIYVYHETGDDYAEFSDFTFVRSTRPKAIPRLDTTEP
jgi:hypothetical protein